MFISLNYHILETFHTISKNKLSKLCKEFCKKNFNIKLVFKSFKTKNYFSYKDPIPHGLKSFLVYINLLLLAVVLAILTKLVVILKLELRSILKRITSLIFLNIYTPQKHSMTHIVLFVLK